MKFTTTQHTPSCIIDTKPLRDCVIIIQRTMCRRSDLVSCEDYADGANNVIDIINKMSDEELNKILDSKTEHPITYDNYNKLFGLLKRASAYYTTVATNLINRMNNLQVSDYKSGGKFDELCKDIDRLDELCQLVELKTVKRTSRFKAAENKTTKAILPVKFKDEFAKLWYTGERPATLRNIGIDSKQKLIACVKIFIETMKLLDAQSLLYKKINDTKVAKVYIEAMSANWEDEGYDSKDEYVDDLEYGILHHSVIGSEIGDDYCIQEFNKMIGLVGCEDGYAAYFGDMYMFCSEMVEAIIKKLTPSN